MQEVYNDGSVGDVKDFNNELFNKLLQSKDVDHVKVFNKETGNKVGISDIEEKDLDNKIQTIVNRELTKFRMQEQQNKEVHILKQKFDRKTSRRKKK